MTDAEMLELIFGGSMFLIFGVYLMILLIPVVFLVICDFKVFNKLGMPGWYCLIPFYNMYQQTKMVYGDGWWFLCSFIPVLGYAYSIKYNIDIARCFGFEWWFGLVLTFLPIVGWPIMAFDKNHNYITMHEGGPLTM